MEEDYYFDIILICDYFKWFYGFLVKKGFFDLKCYKEDLVIYKGWLKEMIDFMVKVFFELEFVIINNGLILLVKNFVKCDLIEFVIYC